MKNIFDIIKLLVECFKSIKPDIKLTALIKEDKLRVYNNCNRDLYDIDLSENEITKNITVDGYRKIDVLRKRESIKILLCMTTDFNSFNKDIDISCKKTKKSKPQKITTRIVMEL